MMILIAVAYTMISLLCIIHEAATSVTGICRGNNTSDSNLEMDAVTINNVKVAARNND